MYASDVYIVSAFVIKEMNTEYQIDISDDHTALTRILGASKDALDRQKIDRKDHIVIDLPFITVINGDVIHFRTAMLMTKIDQIFTRWIMRELIQ